ncbi:TldD/PmbA family protein [Candidatus Microgenomates bacterium]|nr:TldD/PmbA family protein [Candidatus Microgenomates bacterium]
MDRQEVANEVLNVLKTHKVIYGDVRVSEQWNEHIATKDGTVEAVESNNSLGYGIRVIKNGRWGFAASNDLSKDGVYKAAQKAVELATAAGIIAGEKIVLTKEKAIKDTYKTPFKKDPFKVSFAEKIKLLLAADAAQRKIRKIKISQAYYTAWKQEKLFANTEGSWIEQLLVECGGGIEATAVSRFDVQMRSFPNSFRGQFKTGGYEIVENLKLVEHGEQMAQEAVALLTAPECPSGDFDIILDSNQLALQIHESCGHATEGDRALGWEASYAGTTFLTPEKLGRRFRYGSDIVNLTADATVPGGLGTFGYDDEGVPAQRTFLVEKGIFKNYQTSREVAAKLGQKHSNGTVRADGWQHLPMIRMTNINLEPGTWNLESLISDTKKGILFSTNKSWSIDDKRQNFQFGTEIAWEIKNGKKTRMLKNATYTGITPQFWGSCDAICGRDEWVVWGTPNCGKGQPSQLMHTGHGASPARFRKVKCGVIKR